MSRYFDTLNRLRRGRESASPPDLRLATVVEPTAEREPGLSFPELQLASRQASYASLLGLLRATSKPSKAPAMVIAGVSGSEPVHEVVGGIGLQAERQGIALRRGRLDLSSGARTVRFSSKHPLRELSSASSAEGDRLLRLSGTQGSGTLSSRLAEAAAGSDLLLIESPPLSASVEAALLGEACDGLVLVAEAMVTDRSELQRQVEKIRMADCQILGIVLTGTRRWLPGWLERLMNSLGHS